MLLLPRQSALKNQSLHLPNGQLFSKRRKNNIKIIKSKISTTLSNKHKSRVWEVITDKVKCVRSFQNICHGSERKVERNGEWSKERTQQIYHYKKEDQIPQRLPQPKFSSFLKKNRLSAAFRGVSILVSPLTSILKYTVLMNRSVISNSLK